MDEYRTGRKKFLAMREAEKGQRIDDYRVDKISESSVTFTYLPLKTKQELNIQAAN